MQSMMIYSFNSNFQWLRWNPGGINQIKSNKKTNCSTQENVRVIDHPTPNLRKDGNKNEKITPQNQFSSTWKRRVWENHWFQLKHNWRQSVRLDTNLPGERGICRDERIRTRRRLTSCRVKMTKFESNILFETWVFGFVSSLYRKHVCTILIHKKYS